jgi:23S rRNA pseudouridine2605 synthase
MERIVKKIAVYGYCSRRDAEKLVFGNKVQINGKTICDPSIKVSDSDIITINGKNINKKIEPKLYIYNKPLGVITTAKDPLGRKTVFDNILKNNDIKERLVSVGRLDINSEGLLLLTNFPPLANYLERSKFTRVYKVRITGLLSVDEITKIKSGITVKGIRYFGITDVKNIPDGNEKSKNHWIKISLIEGKNREIRIIMNRFRHEVSRLIRIQYYTFKLGTLPKGKIIEADTKIVASLLSAISDHPFDSSSFEH